MRLQFVSDVHTEFHRDKGLDFSTNLPVVSDTLVIAGDFASERTMVRNLDILCKRFKNVLYVFGNHEYYNADKTQLHNKIVKLENRYPGFKKINNEVVEIEGKRILGATMWFRDDPFNVVHKNGFPDFTQIKNYEEWVYQENEKTTKFFKENCKVGDIIVTHHVPCQLSIAEEHRNSNWNRFFLCDQTEIIRENKPSYWIHGHTHDTFSYNLYDTGIECRPFGYIGHEKTPHVSQYVNVIEVF